MEPEFLPPITGTLVEDSGNATIISADDYFDDFKYYSDAQYIVLFAIGILSCLLSVLGSSIIIYLVVKGGRTNELYHRLVLGLSLSDLFMTVTLMFQPIFTPKETGYTLAIGNVSTCRFVGFGYLFFIASYTYNCMLGVYFLAVVRYQTPSKRISKFIEPWGHILAFAMPTTIGVTAISFDMLNVNPTLGACMLFPTDHECTWKDDVRCENQSAHDILNNILDFYALGMVLVGLICTIAVWFTVRRRFHNGQENFADRNDSYTGEEDGVAQIERIQSISRQAVWYTAAYLVGLLCVVVANVVDSIYLEDSLSDLGESPFFFVTNILLWTFFPLQGLFNCLIYIRPRLVRWKAYYNQESWWFAFQQVLTLEALPRWGTSAVIDSNYVTSVRSLRRCSKRTSEKRSAQSDRQGREAKGGSARGNSMDSTEMFWAEDEDKTRLDGFPGTSVTLELQNRQTESVIDVVEEGVDETSKLPAEEPSMMTTR